MVIKMYEAYTVVGERGQITLPKIIRDKAEIKSKERLIVKIENNNIYIVKEDVLLKKDKEKKMIEGYKAMANINKKLENDFKYATSEANDYLGDY